MVGTLAFDLDGTLSGSDGRINPLIIQELNQLYNRGWHVIFITGRGPNLAKKCVENVPFNFLLGCINGSVLYAMPEDRLLYSLYLNNSDIQHICSSIDPQKQRVVFYTESIHSCYWYGTHSCKTVREYIETRKNKLQEVWHPLDLSSDHNYIFSAKVFGGLEELQSIKIEMESKMTLAAPIIKDPFHCEYYVMQATNNLATKGMLLNKLEQESKIRRPFITGGNDLNDLSLLSVADFSFAMKGSPEDLVAVAHEVVGGVEEAGALEGIKKAMLKLGFDY